jgi:hypothetical protein
MLEPSYVIIRPRESYVVTLPKRFVYCKLGVAELKLERSGSPLGLANWFVLLESEIRPIGDGKFQVSTNEIISAFEGMICWYSRPRTRDGCKDTRFCTSESGGCVV